MITFNEANQVKYKLKMKLSNYAWFNSILVSPSENGYDIIVGVNKINSFIKNQIPKDIKSVKIRFSNLI